jgi:uncharacterized protein (DUF1499 family)
MGSADSRVVANTRRSTDRQGRVRGRIGGGGARPGLRGCMNSPAQDRLLPGEQADVAKLRSPLPQPGFLACPRGYCRAEEAMVSPIFEMSWADLRHAWRRIIAAEPRTILVAEDLQRRRSVYVAHTAVLGFPDIVTIEFVALGPDRSSIALYSRSRYGRSDFGTNRRRVERWLSQLTDGFGR